MTFHRTPGVQSIYGFRNNFVIGNYQQIYVCDECKEIMPDWYVDGNECPYCEKRRIEEENKMTVNELLFGD